MRKLFTFFAAALLSVSMSARIVTQDVPLNLETWGWGYNCMVSLEEDGSLACMTTAEWGALATGWNDPTIDLSEWDKIVIVVSYMNGCDGEWFKLKGYLRDIDHKDEEAGQLEGQIDKEADDFAENRIVIDLTQGSNGCDLTKAGVLAIQCQPNGGIFQISRVYFEKEEAEPEVERFTTMGTFNFPTENRPAGDEIDVVGTFVGKDDEGIMNMFKFEATGWFLFDQFIQAAEDDTFKFCGKENKDLVLCQFIPANGESEGKWVQAIFKFGDYWHWSEDGWKGTKCMLIDDLDLSNPEQFAWMEGMPEPDPETAVEYTTVGEKAVKVIRDGQVLILKNGKFYNALGAEVR